MRLVSCMHDCSHKYFAQQKMARKIACNKFSWLLECGVIIFQCHASRSWVITGELRLLYNNKSNNKVTHIMPLSLERQRRTPVMHGRCVYKVFRPIFDWVSPLAMVRNIYAHKNNGNSPCISIGLMQLRKLTKTFYRWGGIYSSSSVQNYFAPKIKKDYFTQYKISIFHLLN